MLDLLTNELWQTVQGGGSKDKIHVRITVLNVVLAMLLRYHTAANADEERWIFCLEMLVLPDDRERLLLGMLADCAGVDKDQVGILGRLCQHVSHGKGHSRKLFAVRLILLTAKGQDKGFSSSARFGGVSIVFLP